MGGLKWDGRIPNAPLRDALLAALSDDLSLSDICRRMGWVRADGRTPETAGLKRCVGIDSTAAKDRKTGKSRVTFVATISLDRAKSLAQALDLDIAELYDDSVFPETVAGLCDECDAPMLKPSPDGLCGLCAEELALFGRIAVAA